MSIKSIIYFADQISLLKQPLTFLRKVKHKLYRLKRAFYYRSSILIQEDLKKLDFIVLKKNTDKWRVRGFENVGTDLYIQIERLKDRKAFLMDQPFFYTLQLELTKNAATELNFVYAVKQDKYEKILKTLKILKLC